MPGSLYLCLNLCDFAAQAVVHAHPELRAQALTILAGAAPLERVFAVNGLAREQGVEVGMSRVQAESFTKMTLVRRNREQEEQAFAELLHCAERFSPKVQVLDSPQEFSSGLRLLLDIANSERLLGSARQIAEGLLCEVQTLGYETDVAVSSNAYAAVLAAGYRGITIIACGEEAEALAGLPIAVLGLEQAKAEVLTAWGVHTVGQLAALPLKPLIARLGQDGQRLHRMACGSYDHLLVPEQDLPDAVLVEQVVLEHPVELLEPLLFLISRALEELMGRARDRALAIASVETCLLLDDVEHSEYSRTVRPALPEQDYPTLLKLIQLDFEMHPPQAGIVGFTMRAWPARPAKVQQGLFAAQAPEAGRLEVLLARLQKLVGSGRVGAPELIDSHAPDAFRMNHFVAEAEAGPMAASHTRRKVISDSAVQEQRPAGGSVRISTLAAQEPHVEDEAPEYSSPASTLKPTMSSMSSSSSVSNSASSVSSALRVMRPPLAVRVGTNGMGPANLLLEGKQFRVETYSGPWRTNGAWWTHPAWCREEWDVVLKEVLRDGTVKDLGKEQPLRCLRLAHDPSASCWYVIGIYD